MDFMEDAKYMAVNSLVFGFVSISLFIMSIILAVVIGLMWYLPASGVALGMGGLLFSSIASKAAKTAEVKDWEGKRLNTGGLVCSIVGTVFSAIFVVVIAAILAGAH